MKLNQPLRSSTKVWAVLTFLLFCACWFLPIPFGKGDPLAYEFLIELFRGHSGGAIIIAMPLLLIAWLAAAPLQYLACFILDALRRTPKP